MMNFLQLNIKNEQELIDYIQKNMKIVIKPDEYDYERGRHYTIAELQFNEYHIYDGAVIEAEIKPAHEDWQSSNMDC